MAYGLPLVLLPKYDEIKRTYVKQIKKKDTQHFDESFLQTVNELQVTNKIFLEKTIEDMAFNIMSNLNKNTKISSEEIQEYKENKKRFDTLEAFYNLTSQYQFDVPVMLWRLSNEERMVNAEGAGLLYYSDIVNDYYRIAYAINKLVFSTYLKTYKTGFSYQNGFILVMNIVTGGVPSHGVSNHLFLAMDEKAEEVKKIIDGIIFDIKYYDAEKLFKSLVRKNNVLFDNKYLSFVYGLLNIIKILYEDFYINIASEEKIRDYSKILSCLLVALSDFDYEHDDNFVDLYLNSNGDNYSISDYIIFDETKENERVGILNIIGFSYHKNKSTAFKNMVSLVEELSKINPEASFWRQVTDNPGLIYMTKKLAENMHTALANM